MQALNGYLMFDKQFSYMQNTIITSSKEVFNGLVGAIPFWIGFAILSSIQLGDHFRFKDVPNAFMTMFYLLYGDTMFDTIYGINQVSFMYCLFFSYVWIWIGNNIIINITLAQVGLGWSEMHDQDQKKWILEPIQDPEYEI